MTTYNGIRADKNWSLPKMIVECEAQARPGYAETKSHEYYDGEEVLQAKVNLLAEALKTSKRAISYTGAGISTSSGINDYATRSSAKSLTKETINQKKLSSPVVAEPTLAHYVLSELYKKDMMKYWVQQNHDGLPQKAGFPQIALNEIHGAWFDPSNPVVQMKGQLRTDLFNELLAWEKKADLVLTIGTSLSGMNADRLVDSCCKRAKKDSKIFGSVIIGLQATPYDAASSLRIYARIDDVMERLAKVLNLSTARLSYIPDIPNEYKINDDCVSIPFDDEGNYTKSERRVLDLGQGQKVRINDGPYMGSYAKVTGKNVQGHYNLRIYHKHEKFNYVLKVPALIGTWWLENGAKGHGAVPGGKFPFTSIDKSFKVKGDSSDSD